MNLDGVIARVLCVCFAMQVSSVARAQSESAEVPAERIASLNLCLDQILLHWVEPRRITSVTWLSDTRPYRRAPLPPHVQLNRGQAEELLALQPDLVLVGQFGAQQSAARLQEFGIRVEKIPNAYSLMQLDAQLGALDDAVGGAEKLQGERGKLQRLLDAASQGPGQDKPVTALILSANNITYGSGMLEHELLERAGFSNLAARDGAGQLQRVQLEEVIAAAPDILMLYGNSEEYSIAHLAERHPVLRHYLDRGRVYRLPAELGFCPALVVADTLRELTELNRELRASLAGE